MMYSQEQLAELATFYKHQLLEDTIPFWFPKSFDEEHGGFLFMRDGDGTLIDDDNGRSTPSTISTNFREFIRSLT